MFFHTLFILHTLYFILHKGLTKKKFKWYEQPFRWANIVLIVLTLLSYLTSFINPQFAGWLSILGLTYPILLFCNIVFLIFWIYRKKATLAFSTFLCILIGWNYLTATIGVNYFSSTSSSNTNQLSIMTYNVRNIRVDGKFDKTKKLTKATETFRPVENQTPDIFCAQEFIYPSKWPIQNKLLEECITTFPFFASNEHGDIICSKYPIINKGEVKLTKKNDLPFNVFADIKINNQFIVRVYSVHLESNKVTDDTQNIELDSKNLQTKSTWRTIYNILKSIKNNQKRRATQIKAITEHVKGSPYPVIICGDFNDTPLSYTVRQTNFLQDNFAKKGTGLGSTYNGNIPFLRIDYILSDRRFKVIDTDIMKQYKASDHFPMISTVSWEFDE